MRCAGCSSAAGQDLDKLVAAAKKRSFKPVPLGIRTSLQAQNKISRVQTANVAGLLPGSDPKLKDEVVVFSAHHDHLGIGEPDATGDRIYNGARDNARGCAQLLAIARALMAALPHEAAPLGAVPVRRGRGAGAARLALLRASIPPSRPGKIAANLNFDSANIWGRTKDITLIDHGQVLAG